MIKQKLLLFLATMLAAMSVSMLSWANEGAHKLPAPQISEAPFAQGKFVTVGKVKMHYQESGSGDPILFLHGNPTSSYLWRNVTPHLSAQGRTIAVDLIGMGYSDKPDIAYSYSDQYTYLSAFIKALDLKNITIVGHDWGAALGFDYARRNPDNVKAIAFMEGLLPPIFPQPSFEAMGEEMGGMFRAFKTPGQGEEMVIKNNMFVEKIMPSMINRTLGENAKAAYREPYLDEKARVPLLAWPRAIPIAGEPAASVQLMNDIQTFMETTDKPVLLLYAEPGVLIPPALIPHFQNSIKNLEAAFIGQGMHFIQEDQPQAIGRAISDWYRRLAR